MGVERLSLGRYTGRFQILITSKRHDCQTTINTSFSALLKSFFALSGSTRLRVRVIKAKESKGSEWVFILHDEPCVLSSPRVYQEFPLSSGGYAEGVAFPPYVLGVMLYHLRLVHQEPLLKCCSAERGRLGVAGQTTVSFAGSTIRSFMNPLAHLVKMAFSNQS